MLVVSFISLCDVLIIQVDCEDQFHLIVLLYCLILLCTVIILSQKDHKIPKVLLLESQISFSCMILFFLLLVTRIIDGELYLI
jgi:hypothetical protein